MVKALLFCNSGASSRFHLLPMAHVRTLSKTILEFLWFASYDICHGKAYATIIAILPKNSYSHLEHMELEAIDQLTYPCPIQDCIGAFDDIFRRGASHFTYLRHLSLSISPLKEYTARLSLYCLLKSCVH